jgi:hypothetical protein
MTSITSLSIYIPRVFANISGSQIAKVFEDLELGKIERIDMVPFIDEKNRPMFRAFVYIQWADNDASHHLQYKITNPNQQAKIVYDNPWFWYLLPNKTPMTAAEVETQRRIEYLEFHQAQMKETIDEQQKLIDNQGKILFDLTKTSESQFSPENKDKLLFGDFEKGEVEGLLSKLGPADEEPIHRQQVASEAVQGRKTYWKISICGEDIGLWPLHDIPHVEDYEVPDYVSREYNSGKMDTYSAVTILMKFILSEDKSILPKQLKSPIGWIESAGESAYWTLLKVAHQLCRDNYGYGVQLENPSQKKQ